MIEMIERMMKMKIGKKAGLAVPLLLLVLLLASGTAAAEVVINEDINKAAGNLEIPVGTIVNGDVTLNLGELTVNGMINGNVSSNMGQVTVNGDVNGNVEANMGQVLINGNVAGDVQARMGEVIVDGSVGGNLSADLGTLRVGGSVGGDVGSGFGELLINGAVAGDVTSRGGKVTINGIVEGDVILDQGVVELGPQAVVTGRVYVARGTVNTTGTTITGSIEIGEEVSGSELDSRETGNGYYFEGVDRNFGERIAERIIDSVNNVFRGTRFMPHMGRARDWPFFPFPASGFYGNAARGVINMLIMFALAALTHTLFPRQVKAAGSAVTTKTGPVIGWGILAAVLAVPLMILLAITIIGIPLIIVVIIALAAATILGYTGIASLVGNKVIGSSQQRQANQLGAIALGVLLIGLIGMIPLLGGLVSLAVYILAVGAALATRFGAVRSEEEVTTLAD
jgi:hypothetical protein